MNKKNCLFQYAYDSGVHNGRITFSDVTIVEDTSLITEKEAEELWEEYYPDFIERLEKGQRPQMCLYYKCVNDTDYGEPKKEIDWRDDLEVKNGILYKKELTKIN